MNHAPSSDRASLLIQFCRKHCCFQDLDRVWKNPLILGVWGMVSGKLFLLSNETDTRHIYSVLTRRQTSLINHGIESLRNVAKVTQLIGERSQVLNWSSLDVILSHISPPLSQRWAHAACTAPSRMRDEKISFQRRG